HRCLGGRSTRRRWLMHVRCPLFRIQWTHLDAETFCVVNAQPRDELRCGLRQVDHGRIGQTDAIEVRADEGIWDAGSLLRVRCMPPDLRTPAHKSLRAAEPCHGARRCASRVLEPDSLKTLQPDRFADLYTCQQAAPVALKANRRGAERTAPFPVAAARKLRRRT